MTTANVAKAWKKAWKSCLSRWKVFLYERHYSKFVIDEYLKFGLLPRLIQRTYDYYYGLLTTARDLGHNAQGPVPWKGSRAESVIRYHADTLGLQRSLAPDYRAHLLEAYVHLRDADKAEYRHDSMQDPLWAKLQELQDQVEDYEAADAP